jgi:protein-S-isoprenylcysteine O-methyltransferase Ste14
MLRLLHRLFALAAAAAFAGSMALFAFVWLGLPPLSLQRQATLPTSTALAIDLALLAAFGLHHSLMARDRAKALLLRFWPTHLERSLYVAVASAFTALLVLAWQPIGPALWRLSGAPALLLQLTALAGLVISTVAAMTFDHLHLVGLRQLSAHERGEPVPPPQFSTPGLYRFVRHPMQSGLLLFLWATPTMTVGGLLFAGGLTLYILIGLRFEERSLRASFGSAYTDYAARVPALLPFLRP